jgi:hypothetical protein
MDHYGDHGGLGGLALKGRLVCFMGLFFFRLCLCFFCFLASAVDDAAADSASNSAATSSAVASAAATADADDDDDNDDDDDADAADAADAVDAADAADDDVDEAVTPGSRIGVAESMIPIA